MESGAKPCKEQRCPNHLSIGPHSHLLSLTAAIMPRGQKSKLRAREKRRHNRALLLLSLPRSLRKPQPPPELLQVFHAQNLMSHFIFGEPRKLITEDLVQEKYLEYRQVPNSDPPRYEFLWGPKAHAETSKMKVLEFWAKVNDTVPTAFPTHYEEALRDGEERARARAAARDGPTATASARSRATSSRSSHP
ncbi:hypothetical protein CB1_001839005 [Camelus ferus]|nr:hypothetical protein CB1_001839005 [Camelus ferus]